eukprot:c26770_g1_i1 orf=2-361(-)
MSSLARPASETRALSNHMDNLSTELFILFEQCGKPQSTKSLVHVSLLPCFGMQNHSAQRRTFTGFACTQPFNATTEVEKRTDVCIRTSKALTILSRYYGLHPILFCMQVQYYQHGNNTSH